MCNWISESHCVWNIFQTKLYTRPFYYGDYGKKFILKQYLLIIHDYFCVLLSLFFFSKFNLRLVKYLKQFFYSSALFCGLSLYEIQTTVFSLIKLKKRLSSMLSTGTQIH